MSKTVIEYTGLPEDVGKDSILEVISVEQDVVTFTLGDSDPQVIAGKNVVNLLVAEGIVALLTKAINRDGGFELVKTSTDEVIDNLSQQ